MSGVAGIYALEGEPPKVMELQAMADAMAYRGRDRLNIHTDGPIGLLRCMLFDTKESVQEILPLLSDDGRFALTFHGRIDNREELHDKIGYPRRLHEITDGEFVLAAFRKWGSDSVQHLLGDFVYAVWDSFEKTLFCARDHFGVKPFYYFYSKSFFAFSSTAKSLLTIRGLQAQLNVERAAEFISWVVADKKSTFFKDIYRLPPGHSIQLGNGKCKIVQYFQIAPMQLGYKKSSQYEEHFREIFTEAVRCRMRSAFPVGSFLSGGLDSSSIVATASSGLRDEYPRGLHTFSGIFQEIASCDERSYFVDLLEKYHLKHDTIFADTLHPGLSIEDCIKDSDEPPFSPHFFMKWNLSNVARDKGMRVMLDGHDGDNAVSYGLGVLNELAMKGDIVGLVKLYKKYQSFSVPALFKRVLWRYLMCFKERFPFLFGRPYEKLALIDSMNILSSEILATRDMEYRLADILQKQATQGQYELKAHLLNIQHPRQPYMLEFLDMLGTKKSLQLRFPYFDVRVINFCLSLPSAEKFKDGYNRSIVRRALSDYLPPSIRERKTKTYFTDNLLNAYDKIGKRWLFTSLDKLGNSTYYFTNKDFLDECIQNLSCREENNRYRYLYQVLRVVSLDKWLKRNNLQ